MSNASVFYFTDHMINFKQFIRLIAIKYQDKVNNSNLS